MIGAYLPGSDAGDAGGDTGAHVGTDAGSASDAGSFAAALNTTGPTALGDTLPLAVSDASAPLGVTFRLRGQLATATAWPSDEGTSLGVAAGSSPNVGLLAPFTDGSRAVALASSGPTFIASATDVAIADLGADDAAFEVVFRSEPGQVIADKRAGGVGWSLSIAAASPASPGGALLLQMNDGQALVEIASVPLAVDAWYHCMLWLSRGAGARVDCDANPGVLTDVHTLGSLASPASLAVGGSATSTAAPLEIAELALFLAPSGDLGSPDAWLDVSRRRFATLTGVMPEIALGTALPNLTSPLRASPAYLDLDQADGSGRHLFLVGEDWPRIACRSYAPTQSFCGYLSEPLRPRLPPASAWSATELTSVPNHSMFADGEAHMSALVASANVAPHVLSATGAFGNVKQVFSFFARAESGHIIGVQVSGQSEAFFDLSAVSVSWPGKGTADAGPTALAATLEDWGQGLFRGQYIFTAPTALALTYELHLLDGSAKGEPFAGDGQTPWVDVAGLQVEVAAPYAGSLIGADPQQADNLVFAANDGNVPSASTVSLRMQVLLPPGPRVTDQAIVDVNLQETPDNQINLFVTGTDNTLQFWGIQNKATLWSFKDYTSPADGTPHTLVAQWNPRFASMWVDQMQTPATEAVLGDSSQVAASLNNIDIGFSVKSSGYLEGLVSAVEVGAQ